jgi:hypothetical protein
MGEQAINNFLNFPWFMKIIAQNAWQFICEDWQKGQRLKMLTLI